MNKPLGRDSRKLFLKIQKAVSGKTEGVITERIVLRDAVCAYLVEQQRRGASVEAIRKAVRRIIEAASEVASPSGGGKRVKRERDLTDRLIRWCLLQTTV